MSVVTIIMSSFAIAAGVLGTLCILVMIMSMGANSTDEQIRMLYRWMLISTAAGLVCLGGGIFLLIKHHPGWAAVLGGLPMIVVVVGIIWLGVSSVK